MARAKAAHLAAYNHIASSAPVGVDHSQIYDHHYYGTSQIPLFHDNRMINTPEGEQTRYAHSTVYANALHDYDNVY